MYFPDQNVYAEICLRLKTSKLFTRQLSHICLQFYFKVLKCKAPFKLNTSI